jgi:ABC-type Mn2+/Zn2+ transport system permease subunit
MLIFFSPLHRFQKVIKIIELVINLHSLKVYGVTTEVICILFSLTLATVVIAPVSSIDITLLAAAIVVPTILVKMLTNYCLKMIVLSCVTCPSLHSYKIPSAPIRTLKI